MKEISLSSPAKINLTLDIGEKTAAGYHKMQSIMMPISLHDTITIVKNTKNNNVTITLRAKGLPCPKGRENATYRAAELFFQAAKIRPAVTITLHKRIPLVSGLGGGSSNAATTLIGLNKLYGNPLSIEKLIQLAKKIGMDTPFFLNPTLSMTTHFGEKVIPITRKNSTLPHVLLFQSKRKKKSTASSYETLDISLCSKKKADTKKLLNFLKNSPCSWDPSWDILLHNDFEQLYSTPSTNTKIHLTGAGPTRFKIHA